MADFVTVATTNDIPPGEIMTVDFQGEEVAIANVDGEYCAFANACTHKGGPLGEGLLLPGGIVECPFHGGQFNVRTGEVVAAPPTEPVKTYQLQVEGDSIRLAAD